MREMVGRLSSVAIALTTISVVILAACGGDDKSTSSGGPAAPCEDAKCLPGNKCLPLDGVVACRKTCGSNDDPASSCPFNYVCVNSQPGTDIPPFCVQTTARTNDGAELQKKDGLWGTPCQPNLGSENPACDKSQGFYCFGKSPTDAYAYCTRYDCLADIECGAGFACQDVNTTPNAGTAKHKTGNATQKICVRRTYCSPCAADVDCTTVDPGHPQHCIVDTAGRGFCTPECDANSNCSLEAKCVTAQLETGDAKKVCYPRSGACIGDGTLCSSCLTDTDCGDDGYCTHGNYTAERFCIKKAPGGDCKQCPKSITSTTPARKVGCADKADDLYPAGYCFGVTMLNGQAADIGCWTPDR